MTAPNLLIPEGTKPLWQPITTVLLVLAYAASLGDLGLLPLFAVASLFLVFFVALRPEWGVYAVLTTVFFLEWRFLGNTYESMRHVALLASINVPIGDLVGLLFGASVALAVAFHFHSFKNFSLNKFGVHWFGLFLLIAFFAARVATDPISANASVWYWLRMMVFPFALYAVLLPHVIASKRLVETSLKVVAAVGFFVAVYGLYSFFVLLDGGVVRAIPVSVFGFLPLGTNHNLLAEPLVIAIPVAIALLVYYKNKHRALLLSALVLMLVVTLLTFSRAAWIALFVEAVIIGFSMRAQLSIFYKKYRAPVVTAVLALLVPITLYMGVFLYSNIVSQATQNRMMMTNIAFFSAARAPLLGYGPGSFQPLLGSTRMYTLDFGDPLDAHGIIQKIIVEDGVIALMFFAGYIVWLFKKLSGGVRRLREFAPFAALAVGILVFEFFNTSYFTGILWVPIGLSLAALYETE